MNLRIPLEDLMWLILRSEFIPERKLHEISLFCWDKAIEHIGNKPYRNMEETRKS